MKSFFSVIIPLYNKANYITETLNSVLNQLFTNFEVIIINDGSTDNSLEKIALFNDTRIKVFSIKNQGVSAARNYGIEKASSKYIAFIDADDYWYPNHLLEHKKLIETYSEQFVFSLAQEFFKYNKSYKNCYSISFLEKQKHGIVNFFEASMISPIVHSSSVVIKKEVFSNIGLFDPKLKSGEDTDLWIRIGLKYNIVFGKTITSRYNYTETGLFKSVSNIKQKIDLSPYEKYEDNNEPLKRYLDINRYALAIQAKLWNDTHSYKQLKSKINLYNLNKKQRILIQQPKIVLKIVLGFKNLLMKTGVNLSSYV